MARASDIQFTAKGSQRSFIGTLSSHRTQQLYSSIPISSFKSKSSCIPCSFGEGLTAYQQQGVIVQESSRILIPPNSENLSDSYRDRTVIPNLLTNSVMLGFTASIGPENSRHFVDDFFLISRYQALFRTNTVLRYKGEAFLNSDGFLQLTRLPEDANYSQPKGAIWLEAPIIILDHDDNAIDWSLQFSCRMNGLSSGSPAGAGLAVVLISEATFPIGNSGSSLGYGELTGKSVALELDTHQDSGDPAREHLAFTKSSLVGPNNIIQSIPHEVVTPDPVALSGFWRRNHVWMDYAASDSKFSVYLGTLSNKPSTPILQYTIDLKSHFFG